jgi:hypothetical protein
LDVRALVNAKRTTHSASTVRLIFSVLHRALEQASRSVPVPAPSVRILREHRQALVAERLALGPAWTDTDLVFPSRLGTPAEPRNVLREFHALVARAVLPGGALPHPAALVRRPPRRSGRAPPGHRRDRGSQRHPGDLSRLRARRRTAPARRR